MAVRFRDLLLELMESRGMERQDLAAAVGISPQHMSSILNGVRKPPSEDRVAEWCRALKFKDPNQTTLWMLAAARERSSQLLVDQLDRLSARLDIVEDSIEERTASMVAERSRRFDEKLRNAIEDILTWLREKAGPDTERHLRRHLEERGSDFSFVKVDPNNPPPDCTETD